MLLGRSINRRQRTWAAAILTALVLPVMVIAAEHTIDQTPEGQTASPERQTPAAEAAFGPAGLAAAPGPAALPLGPAVDADGAVVTVSAATGVPWVLIGLAAMAVAVIVLTRGAWRLSATRSPPRGGVAWASLALCVLMVVVVNNLGTALAAVIAGIELPSDREASLDVRSLAILLLGAMAGQALAVGAYLILRRVSGEPFSKPMRRVAAAVVATAATLLIFPVVLAVGAAAGRLVEMLTGAASEPIAHETLRLIAGAERDFWFWVLVVEVTLGAAIMEEVAYRGLLQNAVRRLAFFRGQPRLAIVVTSMIFAGLHAGMATSAAALWPMLAALLVLSLALGWAYEKTGRLMAPIIMHTLFNVANIALVLAA